ncbi:MAG: NAD(P)/FAD-dependent oxidoreductase [Mobilitalea sp.]
MYDIVIIGAGVAGSFVARELAKYELKVLIVDKDNDVGNETTSANSAIIHAGYDPEPGMLKGKFNVLGNLMYDQICEELDVPFKRCGSLVIGFNDADRIKITELYENGRKNNVPGMRIIEKEELLQMEPNINTEAVCALLAPSAGIISPWELTIALAENAVDNGVELKLETKVEDIKKVDFGFVVITDKGEFETRYVINCAGVYADRINNMVAEPTFEIHPRRGNYYVMDNEIKDVVNHVIFQCPTKEGKGVLVTPTVYGNFMVGPDSLEIEDKEGNATDAKELEYVREASKLTTKVIPFNKIIRVFAGLRASSSTTNDFIVGEAKGVKGFINIAAFDSPGLSSIPAVADFVVGLVKELNGDLKEKKDFHPNRRKVIRFNELTDEEKSKLIKENPAHGNIICRCEIVTEAEIIDCIHRSAGARSVKGVKKRCRPGAGRCQGGFCGPRVLEILARELNIDNLEVPYDGTKSYILSRPTKH